MHLDCDILFALTGDARRNSRALRQIRAFVSAGYSVRVLTLGPPSSEVHLQGVTLDVIRTPSIRGPGFFLYIHRQVLRRARRVHAAVYHASDLFVLPAMVRAAAAHDASVVYDSRELYTGLGATRGRPWAAAFWSTLERRLIRKCNLILTVNEAIADHLAQRYQIDRPLVIPNVPEITSVQPAGRLRQLARLPADLPIVLYQGFLKPGRGCEILVAAARRIPGFSLVFLGEGHLRTLLEEEVNRHQLMDRVKFVPMVPPDELLELTADADVGACLIEGVTESLRLSLPNKLFEYLAAGLPVLASRLPEISRVVADYQVGLTAEADNLDEVKGALERLIRDADLRRRYAANTRAVFERYDPDEIRRAFLDGYSPLIGRESLKRRRSPLPAEGTPSDLE